MSNQGPTDDELERRSLYYGRVGPAYDDVWPQPACHRKRIEKSDAQAFADKLRGGNRGRGFDYGPAGNSRFNENGVDGYPGRMTPGERDEWLVGKVGRRHLAAGRRLQNS